MTGEGNASEPKPPVWHRHTGRLARWVLARCQPGSRPAESDANGLFRGGWKPDPRKERKCPVHSDKDIWWEIVERYGVTIFYTAPTAIRACMKWGEDYPAKHDLSSLRLLGTVGVFGGFWLSYAALLIGLAHGWWGVTPAATVHTVAAFLISWIVIIAVLTAAGLRLPSAFTAIFVLVELALILVLVATVNGSSGLDKAAGIVVFAFAAVGAYVFAGSLSVATGGRPFPLGRPVIT